LISFPGVVPVQRLSHKIYLIKPVENSHFALPLRKYKIRKL